MVQPHLCSYQHRLQLCCWLACCCPQVRLHCVPACCGLSQHSYGGRHVNSQQQLQGRVRVTQGRQQRTSCSNRQSRQRRRVVERVTADVVQKTQPLMWQNIIVCRASDEKEFLNVKLADPAGVLCCCLATSCQLLQAVPNHGVGKPPAAHQH